MTPTHYGLHADTKQPVISLIEHLPTYDVHLLEWLLEGPVELLQLGPEHCLLLNADARQQHQPKNKPASALWFERHPMSGAASDFILGPAIHCRNADVAHLDFLTGVSRKPSPHVYTAAEQLACSLENPDACLACGS